MLIALVKNKEAIEKPFQSSSKSFNSFKASSSSRICSPTPA